MPLRLVGSSPTVPTNNMRIIIEDDAFGLEVAETLTTYYRNNPSTLVNKFVKNFSEDLDDLIAPILLKFASQFFDLKTAVGYERWGAVDNRPGGWHTDLDEHNMLNNNITNYPLCTMIYYPEVKDIIGGRLLTKYETITPKTDRLIMFSPGLLHAVEPFIGSRINVVYNPWSYEIKLPIKLD